jgi:phosphomannomutase
MSIKFGTDGWRAIIGKDYTFENLNRVTQATARWITSSGITKNGVVIGHDARFNGPLFAEHVASIFASMGIPVRYADSIAPTPAVSWAAQHFDCVGIVITASHNPPEYSGFKIKAPFGGPATPDQIAAVENNLDQFDEGLELKSFEECKNADLIEMIPLTDRYLEVLNDKLDLEAIKNSGLKIAHDPMYGAGKGLVKKLLGADQVVEIHGESNPGFNGQAPEPIEKNLGELSKVIVDQSCDVGLANDGDADRIGMYDENGDFVDSHRILSLLTKYLSQDKGMTGSIVKTFSTTNMLNKQAEKYGLPIETTPIGFKYVAEKIIEGDVLVGGEESGGLAVKGHIPERDGIFIGLTIVEMMVSSGKKLSELVQELFDEFGMHAFYRNDMHTSDERKKKMMALCEDKKLTELDGQKVVKWEFIDGVKHIMEDGSWLLVRPSGTEPVLRIYSESTSAETAKGLVDGATAKVNSL